jgi:hypothetical protein
MNRTRRKSIATKVKKRIGHRPKKAIWSFRDFSDLDSTAVAAVLSRLAKSGELRRVRRGIYHRPRSTAFGPTRPDPAAVADSVFRGRRSIPIRGYNRLGLTTQISNEMQRAVDRPTRIKSIRGIKVQTVTRPLFRQKGITEDERVALDALRNLRRIPDTTVSNTLKRIKSLIRDRRLQPTRLIRFALAEPPRVRALVGALAESLGWRDSTVNELRESLNPLTTYRLGGIEKVLPDAAAWHIKNDVG